MFNIYIYPTLPNVRRLGTILIITGNSSWTRETAFQHGKNVNGGKRRRRDELISNQDSAGSERCSWAFAMKINQARVGPPGVFLSHSLAARSLALAGNNNMIDRIMVN